MKKLSTFCAALLCAAAFSVQAQTLIELPYSGAGPFPLEGEGYTLKFNDAGTGLVYELKNNANLVFTGETDAESIAVPTGVKATVTLRDAKVENDYGAPILVEGDLTLNLEGDNTALMGDALITECGIQVEGAAKITINGPGSLHAYGGGTNKDSGVTYGGGAGIGSHGNKEAMNVNAGTIIINGGTIYAQGGYNASSIGGGYYGAFESITINGGCVLANTIGGGSHAGTCGPINITGGTVIVPYSLGAQVPSQGDTQMGPINISGNAIVFVGQCEVGNMVYEKDGTTLVEGTTVTAPAVVYTHKVTTEIDPETGEEADTPVGIYVGGLSSTEGEVLNGGFTFYDVRDQSRDGHNPPALTGTIHLWESGITIPEGTLLTLPEGVTIDGSAGQNKLDGSGAGGSIEGNGGIIAGTINGVAQAGFEGFGIVNATIGGNVAVAISKVAAPEAVVSATSEAIFVKADNIRSVTVTALSGQVLTRKSFAGVSSATISAALPRGVYVVSVATANGTVAKKIVK
jgi:hypothetical protein